MVIELSSTTKDPFPPECKQLFTKVKIVFDYGRWPCQLRTHIQTYFAFDLTNRRQASSTNKMSTIMNYEFSRGECHFKR